MGFNSGFKGLKWTSLENTRTIFINIYIIKKSGDTADPVHATMAFRGVDVWLHASLTSPLNGRESSLNLKLRLLEFLERTLATIEKEVGSSFLEKIKSRFCEVYLFSLPGYEPRIVQLVA